MTTSIFNIPTTSSSKSPKIHFTRAELSSKYLDPTQPPTKNVPYRQIRNVPFAKDVKICMPEWLWRDLYGGGATESRGIPDSEGKNVSLMELNYAKVKMTLKDVLDDEGLRRGNYLLFSSPASPLSNSTMITLECGRLTIVIPHHIYQRSGLSFPTTKLPSGGLKHDPKSARYQVQVDLRQPSMVKGRKPFDRLMYAAKSVEGLCEARVWLFSDLSCTNNTHSARTPSNGGREKKRKRNDAEKQAFPAESRKIEASATSVVAGNGLQQAQMTDDEHSDQNIKHPLSRYTSTRISTTGDAGTFAQVLVPSAIGDPRILTNLRPSVAATHSQRASLPTVLEDDMYDLVEYLSLLFLQSDRITKSGYGKLDSYLCQYSLPEIPTLPAPNGIEPSRVETNTIIGDDQRDASTKPTAGANEACPPTTTTTTTTTGGTQAVDIRTIAYSGFIPSSFITQLLVDMTRRSRSSNSTGYTSKSSISAVAVTAAEEQRGRTHTMCQWAAINIIPHAHATHGSDTTGLMILLQSAAADSAEAELERPTGTPRTDLDVRPRLEREREREREQSETAQMDVDTDMDVQPQDPDPSDARRVTAKAETTERERGRGFRYATCWEFADS